MAPLGYSGPWGKLIREKNQKLELSHSPFNNLLVLKSVVNVCPYSK